jgi:ATP-binding cassette subfamily F protein 3
VLEEALCDFDGTLCFVSHDRHFINAVATRVVHVEGGEALNYPGDYEYYHWKRSQEAEQQQLEADQSPSEGSEKLTRKERKRREAELRREKAAAMGSLKKDLASVEEEIATLEEEKETLQAQMADPTLYEDANKAQAVARRDAQVDAALEQAMARWEEIAAEVEAIEESFA